MSYSCVVCQSGVSRGGRRGAAAGATGPGVGPGGPAGPVGRGRVRRCCRGIPPDGPNDEPRGNVQEPDANRAGGGMPDDGF